MALVAIIWGGSGNQVGKHLCWRGIGIYKGISYGCLLVAHYFFHHWRMVIRSKNLPKLKFVKAGQNQKKNHFQQLKSSLSWPNLLSFPWKDLAWSCGQLHLVGSFPNFCILHGNVGSFFHGETILVNCQRRVKWDLDSDPKSNHETNHKGSKGPKLVGGGGPMDWCNHCNFTVGKEQRTWDTLLVPPILYTISSFLRLYFV